ncbi:MAG: sulfotransferase [Pseudomonadota bacterium]|nr:sulfotransferase [Pseudomonadota bacterium]
MQHIPIFTYHSLNAPGNTYSSNDHLALECDLMTLKALGYRVLPLPQLIDRFLENRLDTDSDDPICAITFDDGVLHDFADFYHPDQGLLKSFARILSQAAESHLPGWEVVPATSFVIASPEARAVLDVVCIAGRDQWHDHWWQEAIDHHHFDIGNHSWDHLHPALTEYQKKPDLAGNFFCIDRPDRAEEQILRAERYLEEKLGITRSRLFAYPYGHVPDYLRDQFFPAHAEVFKAAIATGGDYFCQASPRWAVPRFVCGEDWKSPEEFAAILIEANQRTGLNLSERAPPRQRTLAARLDTASDVAEDASAKRASGAPWRRHDDNESAVAIRGEQPATRDPHAGSAPFFVVGCVRSGTTLLRDLLRQHPNVDSPEETHLFRWPHPFGTVDFTHIQEHNETLRAHREIDGVDEQQFLSLLADANSRRDMQDRYAKLFLAAKASRASRWFDKTPQNIYGILLLSAVYPDAKFVHIVRHPLNVVSSLRAGKVMGPHTIQAGINTWLEAVSIAAEFQSAWPDRIHTLTYEELTTSPESVLFALLDFLGETAPSNPFDVRQVHPERNLHEELLSDAERAMIRGQLAAEMAHYGYV